MERTSKNPSKGQVALSLALLLTSGIAYAFPCDTGYVDGNKTGTPMTNPNGASDDFACLNGGIGDSNVSSADLNAGAGYFGTNTWVYYDKIDTPSTVGSNNILKISTLQYDGSDIIGGNWEFLLASFWTVFSDALIVIKDGRVGGSDGVYWSAYHVTAGQTDGNWSMPLRNLSSMSLYTKAGTNPPTPPDEPVPEPSALYLLGVGLLGFGAMARKKNA